MVFYPSTKKVVDQKMISKIDQLQGLAPWILADCRSPRSSLPDIQDEYNGKGVLSEKGRGRKHSFCCRIFIEGRGKQKLNV